MTQINPRILSAALLALFSGTVSAAGFQLLEQNASGIGVAYAGSAAVADNASTIFFNPAGMVLLPGRQVSVGFAAIGPTYKFRDQGSSGTGLVARAVVGSDGGNAGDWAAVPNAYLSWQLAPQWFVGLGVSSPFGLGTKYEDTSWVGRFQSLKSEIQTINVNPSVAYRVNDSVALGFGLNYQRINAEMSNLTPIGLSRLKGEDNSWGWNAGGLVNLSPSMRLGLAYRSSVKYNIEGDQTVGANTIPAKAKLELPDMVTFSVWQQLSDRWEAMGDLSYTHWSTLDKLNVINRTNDTLLGRENFGYENSWRLAWGAAYKASDERKYKFGLAYDRTPTTDGNRSARVPDNNRLWLSLGMQWKPSSASTLDVGYAYLYVRDPKISQTKEFGIAGSATLRGRFSDSAHVLGLQYTQGF